MNAGDFYDKLKELERQMEKCPICEVPMPDVTPHHPQCPLGELIICLRLLVGP